MDEAGKRRKDPAAWEQRYVDDDLPWDRESPDAHLKGVLHDFAIAKGKVLDIGCGTGTNGIWLDSLGFEVTGLGIVCLAPQTAFHGTRVRLDEAPLKSWKPWNPISRFSPFNPHSLTRIAMRRLGRGCWSPGAATVKHDSSNLTVMTP
jgi:SAM-dependent methyltransferase